MDPDRQPHAAMQLAVARSNLALEIRWAQPTTTREAYASPPLASRFDPFMRCNPTTTRRYHGSEQMVEFAPSALPHRRYLK